MTIITFCEEDNNLKFSPSLLVFQRSVGAKCTSVRRAPVIESVKIVTTSIECFETCSDFHELGFVSGISLITFLCW
jgi:hypothetical protein